MTALTARASRIIDLGVTKPNIQAWDKHDYRRAQHRLLAYCFYPESEKHRHRFFAAISANAVGRLERHLASGIASSDEVADLAYERRLVEELGGYGLLAQADSLDAYMVGQPGERSGKDKEQTSPSDIIIAALIVIAVIGNRGTPGTHKGTGVNAALPVVKEMISWGRLEIPSSPRELLRAWSRAKAVAHLSFAQLAEALAETQGRKPPRRIRVRQFLRRALAIQAFLLKTFPHGRREPIVAPDLLWRLPDLNGLAAASLRIVPFARELGIALKSAASARGTNEPRSTG